jgi:hypothetical protein
LVIGSFGESICDWVIYCWIGSNHRSPIGNSSPNDECLTRSHLAKSPFSQPINHTPNSQISRTEHSREQPGCVYFTRPRSTETRDRSLPSPATAITTNAWGSSAVASNRVETHAPISGSAPGPIGSEGGGKG